MDKHLKPKSRFLIVLALFLPLAACSTENMPDDTTWTDANVVEGYVKREYSKEVIKNPEKAFRSLPFNRVYLLNRRFGGGVSALFVTNENDNNAQQSLIDSIRADDRFSGASTCRHQYYEPIDTRAIATEKDVIVVDETTIVTLSGWLDTYRQPFSFENFYFRKTFGGWKKQEIEDSGYFQAVKAIDKISRQSSVRDVSYYNPEADYTLPIPPPIIEWEVSDNSIISIESPLYEQTITIKGLKPGKVTLSHNEISCEIEVI